ncbi:hypothetical protein L3Q82_003690 [Scortum barcoo]|uniref:Uncharacterized protein n=1 Tax=Scortum barcoo TaxID=214431 RepID=A0ACB8X6E0_9TELE|nr:hypothetical protein L3Q82_003690 [Scortum barcoo]
MDDTAVVGRIANNDESDYRQEVEHLEGWCRQNNLCINVKKTKEMIVDFRRGRHLPLSPVHRRDCGGSGLQLQAHQRLYFLRRLRRAGLGSSVLTSFYRCVVESVLSSCIIVWHGSCSVAEKKALQRVVKAAQRTVGQQSTYHQDIYTSRCRKRASCIMKDPTHTAHTLRSGSPTRATGVVKTRLETKLGWSGVDWTERGGRRGREDENKVRYKQRTKKQPFDTEPQYNINTAEEEVA